MKTRLITPIFLCFCTFALFAQSAETENSVHRITLNTGEVFLGEILVENEQIVMIRTADGSRFQFPRSEVQSIERDFVIETNIKKGTRTARSTNKENFAMIIELHGGNSTARNLFSKTVGIQGSLIFGAQNAVFKNTFIGGGVGYNALPPSDYFDIERMAFLPIFLRFQKQLIDNSFMDSNRYEFFPYFGMDVGYGFSLHSDFGGGAMLKLSVGIAWRINHRNTVYMGVFAGTQNFSGQLTQTNDFGTFSFHGNSTILSLGVKLGVEF